MFTKFFMASAGFLTAVFGMLLAYIIGSILAIGLVVYLLHLILA